MGTDKVFITTFTDPMMGLSWEYEPDFRKLETHFPGTIEFRYMMAVLVPDVYRLVDPHDLPLGNDVAIRNYNARLADIYRSEEAISGMPINMAGFHLFSTDCTSSRPLNIAYKAALLTDREKAGAFLYRLRYATVVECKQTTRLEEILRVADKIGMDTEAFLRCYNDGTAENALNHDLRLGHDLGIRTLPAYLLQYGDKRVLVKILIDYDAFVSVIREMTNDRVHPQDVQPSLEVVRRLLRRHPLISLIEIREALALQNMDEALKWISPLIENGEASLRDGFISQSSHQPLFGDSSSQEAPYPLCP